MNLFTIVHHESNALIQLVAKYSLNIEILKKAQKRVRKNEQEEFFNECNRIASGIISEHLFSREDLDKLERQLMLKRKLHSEVWTKIDKIIKFGGDYSKDRYRPVQKLLDEDRERYQVMSFIVDASIDWLTA